MTENLETAVILMVVGMGTVFTILLLVILGGKVLINLSNKYLQNPVAKTFEPLLKSSQEISPKTIAVITTAVSVSTLGHGKILSLKKKNA